ncbi:MAG TPA: hypothetical protein VIT45_17395 [Allosphingosinicella sp.]
MPEKMRFELPGLVWLAVASLAALAASPAAACSLASDYVGPSNFEMVQIADAIVIATARREIKGEEDDTEVIFAIDSAVKGTPPPSITLSEARLGHPKPSNLDDLSRAHPESSAGMCNRYTFRKGGRYLLFLSRSPDRVWYDLGYPYTRTNEDYTGESDEWIRAVRRYLKLQQTRSPMEQLADLREMAATGRDQDGVRLSASALVDIRSHLGHPSPWKPTPYLLEALRQLDQTGAPGAGFRLPAIEETGLAHMLAEFATGSVPAASDSETDSMRLYLLKALVEGDHPAALPVFEALLAASKLDPERTGLALRFLAKNGHYPRAFQWIETKLMALLPSLSAGEAGSLISAAHAIQAGEGGEGKERWRSDAHAAAAWPELALALYWHSDRFYDNARPDMAAIRQIPVSDYRARPLLTLALGEGSDPAVVAWALAELNDEAKRQASELTNPIPWRGSLTLDPAYLPVRIILAAWSDDRDERLARIFCQGKARRRLLIAILGTHGGILQERIIARIAATPTLTQEERDLLGSAIVQYRARFPGRSDELHWDLAKQTLELMSGREAFAKAPSKPIVCPG